MSKASTAVAISVAALALVVAGCGGGDETSESTAELSKAEFIKQADVICLEGEEELEAEVDAFAEDNDVDVEKPTAEQQEEVIATVVAPGTLQQIEEVADLGAPSGDEEAIEAIVEAVETGASELEDSPELLLEEENPLEEGSQLAVDYGFKECGQ